MSIGMVLPYVHLYRFTLVNNQQLGFCSSNIDLNIAGVIYTGAVGSAASNISTSSGISRDNLELTLLKTGTPFSELEVSRGVLADAAVLVNIEDALELPASLDSGNIVFRGKVGRVEITPTHYKIELLPFTSNLSNPISNKTSPFCRWEFGSTDCGLNLASNGLEYNTIVSSVAGKVLTLTNPPSTNQSRYFNGSVVFTSGNNLNYSRSIVAFSGSNATLKQLPPYSITSGDAITVRAGCNFQISTCKSYGNFSNFGGFPVGGSGFSNNWMKGINNILLSGDKSGEKKD